MTDHERGFVRCYTDDCPVDGYWNGPIGGPCKGCGEPLEAEDWSHLDQ